MGLSYIPRQSLPMLNCVRVPDGVEDAPIRAALLSEYGIEIGAGLGPFKGKAWRIGLMGASSTRRNVSSVLGALGTLMFVAGAKVDPGKGHLAAGEVYGKS